VIAWVRELVSWWRRDREARRRHHGHAWKPDSYWYWEPDGFADWKCSECGYER